MTPDYIIKDIGRKCASDTSSAIHRNISLVDDPRAAFIVATYGAALALGIASGALGAMIEETDPEKLADALWDRLRPMVVSAAEAFTAAGGGDE